jgi:hypothetical protein
MRTRYQNGLITASRQTPVSNSKTTPANGVFPVDIVAQLIQKNKWPKTTGGAISYLTPGTYSWVAPAGVTSVTVTGRGGSGAGQQSSYTSFGWNIISAGPTYSGSNCFGTSLGSSLTKSFCDGVVSSALSTLNAVPLFTNTITSVGIAYLMYCSTTSLYLRYISSISQQLYRTGTPSISSNLASMPSSISGGWSFTPVAYEPTNVSVVSTTGPYAGGASTAFGYTFAGANSGVDASPAAVTYSNISVTPGQSYTIVVGTDYGSDLSFVTIEY